ncbi:MAG: hypothetical protein KC912_13540 [Proteobacteria bacterium]|nr:hypothetical protein [Pseudomonadota bacterium]
MTRILTLAALVLIGCDVAVDPDPNPAEQDTLYEDFEDTVPGDTFTLVDHTTDGGTWAAAEVSAFGWGAACARLSDSQNDAEVGEARVVAPWLDLVAPVVVSVDVAYAMRPFNSQQRLEILVEGANIDETFTFDLDALTDVMIGDGTGSYEPADEEWFTLEAELDPAEFGDEVQVALRLAQDFAGLRPELYVDNVSISPR